VAEQSTHADDVRVSVCYRKGYSYLNFSTR